MLLFDSHIRQAINLLQYYRATFRGGSSGKGEISVPYLPHGIKYITSIVLLSFNGCILHVVRNNCYIYDVLLLQWSLPPQIEILTHLPNKNSE